MRTSHYFSPFIAFALLAGTAVVQATSVRDFLLRSTTEMPGALVEYCAVEHPILSEEMRVEYELFRGKAVQAVDALSTKMPAYMTADEEAMSNRTMTELSKKQMEEIRKLDPSRYCPWLLNSLRSITAESFATRVLSAYERYTKLAASRAASEPRR